MESIYIEAEDRMTKAVANLEREFSKLRTGRASTSLVDSVKVDYHGTSTPINQLASLTIPDSRSIAIQPWDKSSFALIEKAILVANLGLTPVNDGKIIRINLPPLTEERRKDLVKVAKKYAEEAKVALRNARRDANDLFKKKEKDKECSEDECKKSQDKMQKLTDDFSNLVDKKFSEKEKEIMEI